MTLVGFPFGAAAVTHSVATFIRQPHLYSARPTSKDLSEHERWFLKEGGFPKAPNTVSLGENLAVVAGEAGIIIASALYQSHATQLLGRWTKTESVSALTRELYMPSRGSTISRFITLSIR